MPVNPSLIRFTPRSVLMALESHPQTAKKEKKKKSKKGLSEVVENSKEIVLNGGDSAARGKGREVLLRSIAGFLESNGFKKTLAIFQSEAQLEANSWKSSVVDLNDFAAKWSDSSDVLSVPAIEGGKPQDDQQQQERKEKRKKKSSEELEQVEEERQEPQQEKKDKKKKKESKPSENGNVKEEDNASLGEMEPIEGKKDKKKRKESENEETETGENAAKKKDKEGKKSKKKEREKETHENEEKEKVTDKETNVENGEKTVSKKRKKGEEENGENDGKKRKLDEADGKKENQSAEPKSANAFKRVKVEEVKFVDERLQDNSYWAKDGADSGYGAKAQQILEQVRGRDFRHEKTKKKRGSYRGGQIDLQSHSIKFNYSDEE